MMVRSVIRTAVPQQCHQDVWAESDLRCFNRTSITDLKNRYYFPSERSCGMSCLPQEEQESLWLCASNSNAIILLLFILLF